MNLPRISPSSPTHNHTCPPTTRTWSLLLSLLLLLAMLVEPLQAFSASNPSTSATPNGEASSSSSSADQLKIAFVTGNKMKVREVEMILAEDGTTNLTHPEESLVHLRIVSVDLPEIQEVNTHGIAKAKALLGAQLAGGPCLVEDTSLQFHALGGMPGPYIKWFQERLQSEGLYKILTAYEDKSATAVCTLAFCPAPHADPVLFTGHVEGTIVEPQEGRGFGWDSIFVPKSGNGESSSLSSASSSKPFSLLTTEEKNQLSHRGNAVRKWAKWLQVNRNELLERQKGGRFLGHKGLDFKSVSPEE